MDISLKLGLDAYGQRNFRLAYERLLPLAEGGELVAQRTLGHMLYDPVPGWVEASHEEAARWYARAAAQGDIEAQYALAFLYLNGEGLATIERPKGRLFGRVRAAPKSACEVEAYKWLSLAAHKGHAHAKNLKAELRERLAPDDLKEARRRARAWRPRREAADDTKLKTRLSRREIRRL